ncbi:MAG: hypothetical protein AB1591_01725 [Pseudomonadota bacterium]
MKFIFAFVGALLFAVPAHAKDASLALPSGETLVYSRYPAEGGDLLLWFASERGLAPMEERAARDLAARGTEVWQFDLVNAFFLPQTNTSMDGIAVRDMQAIFDAARKTGARVTVYAVNRAAVPVLRGLAGGDGVQRMRVLLMHPHFYSSVDTLVGADYLSFGNLSGVDAIILQPRRSAATPWVDDRMAALRKEGAKVRLLMLEGVREGFWVRESANEFEIAEGKHLAERIAEWGGLFK